MAEIIAKLGEASTRQVEMVQQQQIIAEKVNELAKVVAEVESVWDSTSGAAFRSAYSSVNTILNTMSSTVANGASKLKMAIDKYEMLETQNTQKVQDAISSFETPAF